MNKIISILAFSLSLPVLATPTGDKNLNASSLKFKVYRMAVSTSANCTSPIIVVNNGATAVEVDVKGSDPIFGAGFAPNGTYPCIMFEVDDTIKYSGESSTSGNCSPTSETARDLCRLDNSGTSKLLDGSTFSCTNSVDKIVLYLSTNTVSNPNGNGFIPPVAPGSQDGVHLSSPMVVSGSGSGRLVVNTDGYLCDNENDTGSDCDGPGTDPHSKAACRLQGADFSFSN
jgi:hypothetical protein